MDEPALEITTQTHRVLVYITPENHYVLHIHTLDTESDPEPVTHTSYYSLINDTRFNTEELRATRAEFSDLNQE